MASYAARTKTTVDSSKSEIERTLKRYGASEFVTGTWGGYAGVMFSVDDRRVRFRADVSEASEQEVRRLWRCLLLSIKSRLEIVASGIETFDEAFLPNIVMPDGRTVADHAIPAMQNALEGRQHQELIPFFGDDHG